MTQAICTLREGEKLFDLSLIEKLCRGNEEVRERLIRSFTVTIPKAIDDLHRAHLERDFSTLQRTAHRIKPTLGMYAVVKVEQEIRSIERLAKDQMATIELQRAIEKTSWVLREVVTQMNTQYLNN